MRGDRPPSAVAAVCADPFTPHARGSTSHVRLPRIVRTVYPACAGIDPIKIAENPCAPSLPRMRGDRPCQNNTLDWSLVFTPHARGSTGNGTLSHPTSKFTPHARGSTLPSVAHRRLMPVYPACAGIDPGPGSAWGCSPGLPRMRGDRPHAFIVRVVGSRFTPHARGSTASPASCRPAMRVYPACAGIDPHSGI